MAEDKIAIVGSVGCGKTVLLTVLTHYFQKKTEEGYQIIPDNQEAVNFCLSKWRELENEEWPAPTPPKETPPLYRWKLCYGEQEKQMVTSDIAGEAWRSFVMESEEFSDEDGVKGFWEKTKEYWKTLPNSFSQKAIEQQVLSVKELLNDSTAVFFLLDLSQIINKVPGYEMAVFFPRALLKYMKKIGKEYVPVTLVLTKTDTYKYLLEETGDWQAAVEKYHPWIPKDWEIVPVSAVADVKMQQGRDGEMESCPVQGFNSVGMEELYENMWQIIKKGDKEEILQIVKRLCIVDLPILLGLYLIYLFLFAVSSLATTPSVFFWISLVLYVIAKIIRYNVKNQN